MNILSKFSKFSKVLATVGCSFIANACDVSPTMNAINGSVNQILHTCPKEPCALTDVFYDKKPLYTLGELGSYFYYESEITITGPVCVFVYGVFKNNTRSHMNLTLDHSVDGKHMSRYKLLPFNPNKERYLKERTLCLGSDENSLGLKITFDHVVTSWDPVYHDGSVYFNFSLHVLGEEGELTDEYVMLKDVNVLRVLNNALFVKEDKNSTEFSNFYPQSGITTFDEELNVQLIVFNPYLDIRKFQIFINDELDETVQVGPDQTLKLERSFNGHPKSVRFETVPDAPLDLSVKFVETCADCKFVTDSDKVTTEFHN